MRRDITSTHLASARLFRSGRTPGRVDTSHTISECSRIPRGSNRARQHQARSTKTFVGTNHGGGREIQNLGRNIMWPELFGHETVRVLAMRAEREDLVFCMVEWGRVWGATCKDPGSGRSMFKSCVCWGRRARVGTVQVPEGGGRCSQPCVFAGAMLKPRVL